MWITNQKGNWSVNSDTLKRLYTLQNRIVADQKDGESIIIGSYATKELARIAYDGLMRALDHGANTWEMLSEEEDAVADGLVDAGLVEAIYESLVAADFLQNLKRDPDAVREAIKDGINESGIWRSK